MAKGLIIWGSTAMLAGWACGAFGLLGVRSEADEIKSWPLNIAGLSLALLSLAISLLLKPEAHKSARHKSLSQALLEARGFDVIIGRQGDGAGAPEVRFALEKENAEVHRQLPCGVCGWWCQESLRVCKGGEGLTAVAYGGCV